MNLLEPKTRATDSYIYGYPLVLSHVASEMLADGELNRMCAVRDIELECSIGHGAQILTSAAWLDIDAEPMVLTVPKQRRYYAIAFYDAWTNPVYSVGPRMVSKAPDAFIIVKEGRTDLETPRDCMRIEAPTGLVRVSARVASYSERDVAFAVLFRHRIALARLGRLAAPSDVSQEGGRVVLSHEAAVQKTESMRAADFFLMLTGLLRVNPPSPLDAAMQDSLQLLHGIGLNAAERDAHSGKDRIRSYRAPEMNVGGWAIDSPCEPFGARDYLRRAAVARARLYNDVAPDYIRFIADRDAAGDPLDGRFRYSVMFDRSSEPPARGPWFIGTRPTLRTCGGTAARDADGTTEVLLGRDPAHLPVERGRFSVVLHVFWPDERIMRGAWLPPSITRETHAGGQCMIEVR
jgi:hypothetical protein